MILSNFGVLTYCKLSEMLCTFRFHIRIHKRYKCHKRNLISIVIIQKTLFVSAIGTCAVEFIDL